MTIFASKKMFTIMKITNPLHKGNNMKLFNSVCLIGSCLLAGTSYAADIGAGKEKAATCVACHGADGISSNPMWPNLAGQHAQYMVLQLKAFKDGSRKNSMMNAMAQSLSDEDMENLAAYFESLSSQ